VAEPDQFGLCVLDGRQPAPAANQGSRQGSTRGHAYADDGALDGLTERTGDPDPCRPPGPLRRLVNIQLLANPVPDAFCGRNDGDVRGRQLDGHKSPPSTGVREHAVQLESCAAAVLPCRASSASDRTGADVASACAWNVPPLSSHIGSPAPMPQAARDGPIRTP